MSPILPADVLYLISVQLWHQRDFNTLFNCALSFKQLAAPALANIYRMHNRAPFTNGGSDEVEVGQITHPGDSNLQQQGQSVSRWAGLWRTMILSSLNKTAYPYCQYIRTLDLRDLRELLEDPEFRLNFGDDFFSGDLARFKITIHTPAKPRSKGKETRLWRLNTSAALDTIGEEITKHTPMLQDLAGEISLGALISWIPRLPRLQQLTLWSGAALADDVAKLIHVHCPHLKSLSFYEWPSPEADALFALFLRDIRPHSLEFLEVYSYSNIGSETFSALNCHSDTLTELKLNNIKSEAMPFLSQLKGCTALTSLHLTEDTPATDLENNQNDVFLEIIEWLRNCKGLQNVTFEKMLCAPAILKPILLDDDIHLVKLEVIDYSESRADKFHRALSHQTSLHSILLKSIDDDCDIDILVESLSQLTHLRELHLRAVSDNFSDDHICKLAQNLPSLEDIWIGGNGISDDIWDCLARLSNLRGLEFNAWTVFTKEGILRFISQLGPGNWGLSLAIMTIDPGRGWSDEDHALLRSALAAKVAGKLDYALAQDHVLAGDTDESDSS